MREETSQLEKIAGAVIIGVCGIACAILIPAMIYVATLVPAAYKADFPEESKKATYAVEAGRGICDTLIEGRSAKEDTTGAYKIYESAPLIYEYH